MYKVLKPHSELWLSDSKGAQFFKQLLIWTWSATSSVEKKIVHRASHSMWYGTDFFACSLTLVSTTSIGNDWSEYGSRSAPTPFRNDLPGTKLPSWLNLSTEPIRDAEADKLATLKNISLRMMFAVKKRSVAGENTKLRCRSISFAM